MEAALDVFAALVTREAEKGNRDGTTAVYTALMAACEKVSTSPRTIAAVSDVNCPVWAVL
jgi:hypothetical protein